LYQKQDNKKGVAMKYQIKLPLLGFEEMTEVELIEMDEMFSKIRSIQNPAIEITLVNPYVLREYSFDVPKYISLLLEIQGQPSVKVYCVVVVQNPIEESRVNFLAPIIFNQENATAAQIALSVKDYPDFKVADEIKHYMKD